ncbi:MAG: hypothetical protein F4Z85_16175 [Gemmatimonadetes bacterium]|nr:hypothetical protein [Gemmatimonadota bacterium]MYB69229.1 hypothetical protein [Gemmatimonadota bacterium]
MNFFFDPVFWVEWLMLSALLGIGIYVSYTDLTMRRVPNRCTVALLAVGLLGQALMTLLGETTLAQIGWVLLTSLVLVVTLTLVGLWAPGDAKLFWAASAALPPTLCPTVEPFSLHSTTPALLINALWCYLLILLVISFSRRDWKQVEAQGRPSMRHFGLAAWALAALLGWVLWIPVLILNRPLSYLEALAVIAIGYRLLEWGLKEKYWPVVLWPGTLSLLYLVWVADKKWPYFLFWGTLWLFELGYLRLRHWHSRGFVQAFPLGEVRPGASPHDTLRGPEEELLCESGMPLSEDQVARLRKLASEGRLPSGYTLMLEHPFPFVPFIVGGAMLTAIFAGNTVLPLTRLIEWLRG